MSFCDEINQFNSKSIVFVVVKRQRYRFKFVKFPNSGNGKLLNSENVKPTQSKEYENIFSTRSIYTCDVVLLSKHYPSY